MLQQMLKTQAIRRAKTKSLGQVWAFMTMTAAAAAVAVAVAVVVVVMTKRLVQLRNYKLLKQESVYWSWSLCNSPHSCT